MAGNDSVRVPEKTLMIVPDRKFGNMLRLKFKEGGNVPAHLSGLYMKRAQAKDAVDYYNAGYDRKKIYPQAPAEPKKVAADAPLEVKPIKEAEVIERAAPPKKKVAPKKEPERSVKDDGEAKGNS